MDKNDKFSIEKPTLVKGMFRELSILSKEVKVYQESSEVINCTINLVNDSSRNTTTYDENVIFSSNQIKADHVEIRFHLDDTLWKAKLKRGNKAYHLPHLIYSSQSRDIDRIHFKDLIDMELLVEIRGVGHRCFGKLLDASSYYLAVEVLQNNNFCENELLEVHIYSESEQVYSRKAKLITVRGKKLVLDLTSSSTEHLIRTRREVVRCNESITISWIDRNVFRISGILIDVDLYGAALSISQATKYIPPVGSIVNVEEAQCKAKIIRHDSNTVALDLRVNDTNYLDKWMLYLRSLNNTELKTRLEKNSKIFSIFFRSGYLNSTTGGYLKSNINISRFLITGEKASRWIKRYYYKEQCKVTGHVSFLKISNNSWFAQEISHISNSKSIGKDIIKKSLLDFYENNKNYYSLKDRFSFIVDMKIKFHEAFWPKYFDKGIANVKDVTFMRFANSKRENSEDEWALYYPTISSWEKEYRDLSNGFDLELLNGFGIDRYGFKNFELEKDLFESGYSLNRKVLFIKDSRGEIVTILIKLGLPALSNLTNSANNLWIFTNDRSLLNSQLSSIENSSYIELLYGASGALIVGEENSKTEHDFKIVSMSLHRLKEFIDD